MIPDSDLRLGDTPSALDALAQALSELTPMERDAFLLVTSGGLSHASAREQLKLTAPEFDAVLAQALVALAEAIDRWHEGKARVREG